MGKFNYKDITKTQCFPSDYLENLNQNKRLEISQKCAFKETSCKKNFLFKWSNSENHFSDGKDRQKTENLLFQIPMIKFLRIQNKILKRVLF